jgi:hypothetical protein
MAPSAISRRSPRALHVTRHPPVEAGCMTTDAHSPAHVVRARRTTATPNHSPAFISVAQVMLGTASLPSTSVRGLGALRNAYAALLRARAARRACPPRRSDYMERAAMAREMNRL